MRTRTTADQGRRTVPSTQRARLAISVGFSQSTASSQAVGIGFPLCRESRENAEWHPPLTKQMGLLVSVQNNPRVEEMGKRKLGSYLPPAVVSESPSHPPPQLYWGREQLACGPWPIQHGPPGSAEIRAPGSDFHMTGVLGPQQGDSQLSLVALFSQREGLQ